MPLITFLPYQKRWITNPSQFAICEKSRRVGITYAEAYRVTRDLSSNNVKNKKVWFSSADLSASEEFIDYVGFFATYLNTAAKYIGEVVIDKEKDITAHRVRFSNGCECNAISSNPTRFRSKGGDVVLDEFAHHHDQEKMYTASKPTMMWGNRVRIISTHNGDDSFFFKLVKETLKNTGGSMKNWTHFKITIDDAIKDGLVDKIIGHKAAKEDITRFLENAFSGMTQEAIDEEFYCTPNSSSKNHVLALEFITAIERDDILNETLSGVKGDIYAGMDIGRFNNPSVIWVLEKLGEILYTRKVICMKNTPWAQQRLQLNSVLSHPNFRRCCIDNSSMGTELFGNARQVYGAMKVEGIKFSAQVKESLASYLVITAEERKVLIPRDNTIREDLYSLKGIKTTAGNTRYETDSPGNEAHADHFWALALALEASKTYSGPLIITSRAREQMNSILQNY